MSKIRGLRWWMITLIMLGSVINYLTRITLAVAAPKVLLDLQKSEKEYPYILGAFQGAIMAQPVCGYVKDVLGPKIGFAIFAVSWSIVNMLHSLANSCPVLAFLRGLLSFAEGSANPAGIKATAEWFPAKERGLAGGIYNIGASAGSMIAPPLVTWAILTYNWRAAGDPRPARNRFRGIVLQEYSHADWRLVGPTHLIFRGTPIWFTEGPHLYRRNGWYYLITAEGGHGLGRRGYHGAFARDQRTL